MEAARAAISKITSRGGTHDTTVDETVNPSVTSETVKPTRHEQFQEAVDKEVHQDHYHTTVQPLQHREVLPEQHVHRQQPVQEREFRHGDDSTVQRGVQAEQAAFANSSVVADTAHSSSQAGAVTGEHVHHHVHETVQPIVHKETVRPEVVHTTIPIHERHQAPSEHHGLSTMPVKSLDEFKTTGVPLTGTAHRSEHYEGDPRQYNPAMQIKRNDVDVHPAAHDGPHDGSSHTGASTAATYTGPTGTGLSTGSSTGFGTSTSAAQTGALRGSEHGISSHQGHHHGTTADGLSQGTSSGFGTGTSAAQTGALRGSEYNTSSTGTRSTGDEYSSRDTAGVTPAHNITTADHSTRDTGAFSTPSVGHTGTHTSSHGADSAHLGHQHREGHGTSNQIHHGSTADNVSRDDPNTQHGTQSRDPAVEDRSDKKLTGTGVDGSHSAVFGLTPDGHKHKETSSTTTAPQPAHTRDGVSNIDRPVGGTDNLAGQMHNPEVHHKSHGGQGNYDGDSNKPGHGAPGGEQGFGTVRPGDHGGTTKMQDKIDPRTDADGDGKRGVMD